MTLGIVGTLIAVLGFNFQTELLSGMRQPKSVSSMQLVQSLSFTFLAIPCLYCWADWRVLVFCYGMATVLGCGIGLRAVFKVRDSYFVDTTTLSWLDLARRHCPLRDGDVDDECPSKCL